MTRRRHQAEALGTTIEQARAEHDDQPQGKECPGCGEHTEFLGETDDGDMLCENCCREAGLHRCVECGLWGRMWGAREGPQGVLPIQWPPQGWIHMACATPDDTKGESDE